MQLAADSVSCQYRGSEKPSSLSLRPYLLPFFPPPVTFNFSPDFITLSDTTFWSDLFLVGRTLLRGGELWSARGLPATVGTRQVFVGWRPE